MNSKTKSLIIILIIAFICVSAYLFLDYINICSVIGISIERFNTDIMGIVFNALLAVILYAITYNFVDKRNESRQKNKELVLKLMLTDVYDSCLSSMQVIDKLSKKRQGVYVDNSNKPIDINKRDEIIRTLEKEPFENEHNIIEFFKDGSLSETEYKAFTDNKKKYLHYVLVKSGRISGLSDENDSVKNDLDKNIRDAIKRLNGRDI